MTPDEALERARAEARPFTEEPVWLRADPVDAVTTERLMEWSLIEPRLDRVYSSRRGGRALSAGKRLMVRLLRQYFAELIDQENRFNAMAAVHIARLEDRIRELEAQLPKKP